MAGTRRGTWEWIGLAVILVASALGMYWVTDPLESEGLTAFQAMETTDERAQDWQSDALLVQLQGTEAGRDVQMRASPSAEGQFGDGHVDRWRAVYYSPSAGEVLVTLTTADGQTQAATVDQLPDRVARGLEGLSDLVTRARTVDRAVLDLDSDAAVDQVDELPEFDEVLQREDLTLTYSLSRIANPPRGVGETAWTVVVAELPEASDPGLAAPGSGTYVDPKAAAHVDAGNGSAVSASTPGDPGLDELRVFTGVDAGGIDSGSPHTIDGERLAVGALIVTGLPEDPQFAPRLEVPGAGPDLDLEEVARAGGLGLYTVNESLEREDLRVHVPNPHDALQLVAALGSNAPDARHGSVEIPPLAPLTDPEAVRTTNLTPQAPVAAHEIQVGSDGQRLRTAIVPRDDTESAGLPEVRLVGDGEPIRPRDRVPLGGPATTFDWGEVAQGTYELRVGSPDEPARPSTYAVFVDTDSGPV